MTKYTIVYVTVPNKKLGVKIGRACVEAGLVACSNVIDKVTSIYKWQGKIHKEAECILIMKTIQKNSDDIIKLVKELHPSLCPCILTLPILAGNESFLYWISQSLQ